jgi:hypothetical protein
MVEFSVSERFACRVFGQHRSTQRKTPKGRAEEGVDRRHHPARFSLKITGRFVPAQASNVLRLYLLTLNATFSTYAGCDVHPPTHILQKRPLELAQPVIMLRLQD